VTYLGGHPLLAPEKVRMWRAGDTIAVEVGRRRVDIAADRVKALRFIPRSQVVFTGGGFSLGGMAVGATAGNALAGDVGETAGVGP
jgi:hypothetical protein